MSTNSFLAAAKKTVKDTARLTINPGADLAAEAEIMAQRKRRIDELTAEYDEQQAAFKTAVLGWRDMVCEEQPSRHSASIDIPISTGKVQVQFRAWSGSVPPDVGESLAEMLGDVASSLLSTKRTLAVKASVLKDPAALEGLIGRLQGVMTADEFGAAFEYTETVIATEGADKLQFSLSQAQRQQLVQSGLKPVLALRVTNK